MLPGADHSLALRPDSTHTLAHTPRVLLCQQGGQGGRLWAILATQRPGRIWFGKIVHPGRLVSYFVILVIDFVTALFNLGV